ncbi:Mammalian cell entry related domain protein [Anaerovibrio sp. JC8]|uniref:MlaD family protein n=1 Tax=Anaerovibrio sp. JC8 TaxID=1240085 RepID=UPI000A0C4002|nr:MlaD family protein [Anaerovibrio sp. JC8]ORU00962.1 Mammalian cell entry related domain protein [Anaerovibrio sp. JC8]
MNTEVKVGAFTVGGLALVMAVFVFLTNFSFGGDKSYNLYVNFGQAIGLTPGNAVAYAGVTVGSVEAISPNGPGVLVKVKIKDEVKIPRKSAFTITSNGVMGAKFVNIQPAQDSDLSDCYQPDDYVEGQGETGIDNVMEGVSAALDQVHELLANLNDIIGDNETKTALKDISMNMRQVTENMNVMTATLANVAVSSQDDIRNMARNLNLMTASLTRSANSVEAMVNTFSGDGATAENLKVAVNNLSEASVRLNNMAKSLEGVVTDPQVADDLKTTIHNTRNLTERADNMMSKISSIKVGGGLETMYSGNKHDWSSNLDLGLYSGNSYGKIGVSDIGRENYFNLQGGTRSGMFGAHGGIIDSKAGLGIDLFGGNKVQLSVDAYDPNDFKLRSRLQFEVAPDTYLFTQVNDINRSRTRATYFGIRRSF